MAVTGLARVDPAGQPYPAAHGPLHVGDTSPGALPNLPAGQGPVQAGDPAPAALPKDPMAHMPEQFLVVSANAAPKVPGGHREHTSTPPSLYVLGPHRRAVALTEPEGQAYPGAQGPAHTAAVYPVPLPNRPAAHGPLQEAVGRAVAAPKVPGGQSTQTPIEAVEYRPMGHVNAVPLVDPAGQAYPALQFAVHEGAVAPALAPKTPAAQGPEQPAVVRPLVAPKVPGGQGLHTAAPPVEYLPGPHRVAVALVDLAGQACPAAHCPEQAAEVRAEAAPNTPAGQSVHRPAPAKEYCPAPHAAWVGDTEPVGQK